jgi:hypothetical protein
MVCGACPGWGWDAFAAIWRMAKTSTCQLNFVKGDAWRWVN